MSALDTRRKPLIIFIFSIVSICIFVLFYIISMHAFGSWRSIFAGAALMLAAIPFHLLGRKSRFFLALSFVLNSAANGFSVSAYYLQRKIPVSTGAALSSVVPAAAALLVIYMFLIINLKRKKAIIACGLISELILLVLFLTLRISDGNLFCGFACFSIIIAMFYTCVFGISVNRDERSVLRDISYGSFGAFVVITAAVIFLLTEGEVLDGLEPDIADIGISEKRKKQRHKG